MLKVQTMALSAVFAAAALLPLLAGAHGATEEAQNSDSNAMNRDAMQQRMQQMRGWEDAVLGNPLHREMESLMTKLQQGTITEEEWRRLSGLIGKYPGPALMMHQRTMMQSMMGGMMARMMGGRAGMGMEREEMPAANADNPKGYGMPLRTGGGYMALMLAWQLLLLGAAFAAGWFLARRARPAHPADTHESPAPDSGSAEERASGNAER